MKVSLACPTGLATAAVRSSVAFAGVACLACLFVPVAMTGCAPAPTKPAAAAPGSAPPPPGAVPPGSVAMPTARIVVSATDSEYRIGAPFSRLTMSVPRGTLSRVTDSIGGATASPRYFHFRGSHGLELSGWFEGSDAYTGFDSFWQRETNAWRSRGMPELRNVARSRLEGWEFASYDFPLPAPAGFAHIRAERVQAGAWIDLHISVVGNEPIAALREKAMDTLKQVRIDVAP